MCLNARQLQYKKMPPPPKKKIASAKDKCIFPNLRHPFKNKTSAKKKIFYYSFHTLNTQRM
jgi:hypothetical protein